MNQFTTLISILFFTLLSAAANASIYVTEFSGILNRVDSTGKFTVGDPFTGRAEIDYKNNEIGSRFTEVFGDGTGTILRGRGSVSVSIGSVGNEYIVRHDDMYFHNSNDCCYGNTTDDYGFQHSSSLGLPPDVEGGAVSVDFRDITGSMFSSLALPLSIPAYVTGIFELTNNDGYGTIMAGGTISNVSISVVPIPGAVWLLGSGVARPNWI